VGRSDTVKNPYAFIELAKRMPSQNFIMICPPATNDKYYEKLKHEAEKIKNLKFVKRIPYSEIHTYFQKAKVFINTSFTEGYPNTFIEACRSSTPVVSLNINPDNFLTEYSCGICCLGDFGKLCKAIKSILKNNRYIESGENARKYFDKNHKIENVIKDYKKTFDNLIN
jgi:glycosyltransferase involved in cell wall biosynthesis